MFEYVNFLNYNYAIVTFTGSQASDYQRDILK